MGITKNEETLALSTEILTDLELGELPLDKIVYKCLKLARLINDLDAIEWFSLELHGYNKDALPENIDQLKADLCAIRSGRHYTQIDPTDNTKKYFYSATESIPALEAAVDADLVVLQSLKLPDKFQPAVSHIKNSWGESSHVVESYKDVLNAIVQKQVVTSEAIKRNRQYLARIKENVYQFVLEINFRYKFENQTESLFQKLKEEVDDKLEKLTPLVLKKFSAAYSKLDSENEEEWSQAMQSCRNILAEYSDKAFKSINNGEYTLTDGSKIIIDDSKYINKIIAGIDKKAKKNKLLAARVKDLTGRIKSLYDFLSQGAKNELKFSDVASAVIETYFLLADLLNYSEENTNNKESAKAQLDNSSQSNGINNKLI